MLLAGPLGHTQQETITRAPAFTPETLTALPTTSWLTNGGNIENLRYSPLDEINRETVEGLRAAWRVRLGCRRLRHQTAGSALTTHRPVESASAILETTRTDP